MSSTSPDGPPRRRTGIGRIVFSVIAVLTVLAASAFSIRSASGGNDIRTNLTLIAPAAAGGGWDSFQRELQQTNEELEEKASLLAEQNKKVEQKNREVEAEKRRARYAART